MKPIPVIITTYLHGLPWIVYSDDFDKGQRNEPWSVGDWNEYKRGQDANAFEENQKRLSQNQPSSGTGWDFERTPGTSTSSSSSSGSGGGGGGGEGDSSGILGLLMLALGVVALAVVGAAAIGSLLAAALLIMALRRVLPHQPFVRFKPAYLAAGSTILAYLVAAGVLSILQFWFYPPLFKVPERFSELLLLKYFFIGPSYYNTGIGDLRLLLHGICTLIASFVLREHLWPAFVGLKGYGRALLATIVIVLPSAFAGVYAFVWLLEKLFPGLLRL